MPENEQSIELVIPLNQVGFAQRYRYYSTGQETELVLRGSHVDVAAALVKAIADLTGDPILSELDADDPVVAVRTLAEVNASGIDINPHDDLGLREMHVADNLGGLWAKHVAGCGWCGDTAHEADKCPSEEAVTWRNICEQCGDDPITDTENKIGARCVAYNLSRCS